MNALGRPASYERGRADHERGVPIDRNPHPDNPDASRQWAMGWWATQNEVSIETGAALEAAGAIVVEENGDRPGVSLRKAKP